MVKMILLMSILVALSVSLGYMLANVDWKTGEWKEW